MSLLKRPAQFRTQDDVDAFLPITFRKIKIGLVGLPQIEFGQKIKRNAFLPSVINYIVFPCVGRNKSMLSPLSVFKLLKFILMKKHIL